MHPVLNRQARADVSARAVEHEDRPPLRARGSRAPASLASLREDHLEGTS